MKTSAKKLSRRSLADVISLDEFRKEIKKAEKGPFRTIEEAKKLIKEWREQKHSQIKVSE